MWSSSEELGPCPSRVWTVSWGQGPVASLEDDECRRCWGSPLCWCSWLLLHPPQCLGASCPDFSQGFCPRSAWLRASLPQGWVHLVQLWGGVPVEGAEVLSPSMAQWSRHWGWLVKLSLPCFPLQSWGRLSASSSTEGFAPRVSAAKGQGWDWHRPERSWGRQGAGWDPSLLHDQPKSVAGCSVVSGLASFGPKC